MLVILVIGLNDYFLYNIRYFITMSKFEMINSVGGGMRKLIFLVAIIVVSTYSFADIQSLNLTKPKQIKDLNLSWKIQKSVKPQPIANDMTIVYGGADISQKQMLNLQPSFIV